MKFQLRKPCRDCPFLRGRGYLHPQRAEQIANYVLRDDKTFACHKHLKGHGEDGEAIQSTTDQHCAGALLMDKKAGHPNAMIRFARMLGIYDADQLKDADIYETAEEMRDGHDHRKQRTR